MIPIGSAVALIYRSKASGIPMVLTPPRSDWYVCARQNRGYFAVADMRDRRALRGPSDQRTQTEPCQASQKAAEKIH